MGSWLTGDPLGDRPPAAADGAADQALGLCCKGIAAARREPWSSAAAPLKGCPFEPLSSQPPGPKYGKCSAYLAWQATEPANPRPLPPLESLCLDYIWIATLAYNFCLDYVWTAGGEWGQGGADDGPARRACAVDRLGNINININIL